MRILPLIVLAGCSLDGTRNPTSGLRADGRSHADRFADTSDTGALGDTGDTGDTGGSLEDCTADLGIAQGWTLFAIDDYTSTVDVGGRIAAGGDVSMTGFSIAHDNPGGDALVVGQDATLHHGQIFGNIIHGGTLVSDETVTLLGGVASSGSPLDFSEAEAELQLRSTRLAALAANGTTTVDAWGSVELVGNGDDPTIFTVDGTDLTDAHTLRIDVPSATTVVVNVTGDLDLRNMGIFLEGATDPSKLVFNLPSARSLALSGIGLQGHVLAPFAEATFDNGNVRGALIVSSLSGDGQLDFTDFEGTLPCLEDADPDEPEDPEAWTCSYSWTTSIEDAGIEIDGVAPLLFKSTLTVVAHGTELPTWSLEATLGGDQQVTAASEATWVQSGNSLTITGSATLHDETPHTVELYGLFVSSNDAPTAVTMEGVACTEF